MLFVDEPTGNLDAASGARVADLLFDLNHASGTTLLLVTHEPDIAAHASRIIEMRDGRIRSDARQAPRKPAPLPPDGEDVSRAAKESPTA